MTELIISIRCDGAGKHLKYAGQRGSRHRIETLCVKLKYIILPLTYLSFENEATITNHLPELELDSCLHLRKSLHLAQQIVQYITCKKKYSLPFSPQFLWMKQIN